MRAVDVINGRVRWFTAKPARVYGLIFGLYLLARLVIIIGGDVFQSWDSAVYAYRDDPARNQGPLVSFFGDAPRPWGLPLFYALFGSDEWRAIGQWAFATVVWAFFAWEVSRSLRTRAAQYAVVAGLLFLLCLNNIASWDLAMLTESMSIHIGVLVLALLLRWFRTGSVGSIVAMSVAAIWWNFIRPDIRLFLAVMMVVLVGVAARAWWKKRQLLTNKKVVAALGAVVAMGLGIVWYSAITPGMTTAMVPYDDDALHPTPLPQDEQNYVYRLRVDASLDPELWQAFKTQLGMPTCPELEAFTSQTDWQGGAWAEAYTRCPPLVAWVAERKGKTGAFWTELASKNPGLAARKFLQETSYNLGGDIYAHVPQVVPGPIEKLVFPSRRYGLPVVLVGFGIAFGLAWWAGARRTDRRLFWFSTIVFVTAIGSAVATIAIHTGEIQRYGMQETVATKIATVIMLACALDAWLVRRRGPRGDHTEEASSTLEPSRT